MISRVERVAVEVLVAFIAVSAFAGGIGLVGGGLNFPPEWLASTPFDSYVVPGAILALVVGGSSFAALALLHLNHWVGVPVALAAGLIQVGWIIGEVMLVGTQGETMLWLQVIYLIAGAVVAALAAHIRLRSAGSVA